MLNSLIAIVLVLLSWAGFGLLFIGVGLGLRRLLGLRPVVESFLSEFWIGWCVTIGLLQCYHLFRPVDTVVLVIVAAVAAVGLWFGRDGLVNAYRAPHSRMLGVLSILAVLAIASQAVAPIRNYDTGLYHLTCVRWLNEYAIVPGLGNMHTRLAFNSSYFLYAALLQQNPLGVPCAHTSAGLVMAVVACELLRGGVKAFSRPAARGADVLAALLLGPAAMLVFGSSISSLSTDLAVFAVGLVVVHRLVGLLDLAGGSADRRTLMHELVTIGLLCATGACFKLSFAVTAVVAILVAWGAGCRAGWRGSRREYVLLCGMLLAIGIPWLIRGAIVSGYILFPSTRLPLPVDWRVPPSLPELTQMWIYSWARHPGAHWTEVVGNHAWVAHWIGRVGLRVWIPVGLFCVSLLCWAVACTRRGRHSWLLGFALLPWMTGSLAWFMAAPDPRLTGGSLWICALLALLLLERGLRLGGGIALCFRWGCTAVVVTACLFFTDGYAGWMRASSVFPHVPTDHQRRATESGLVLHLPANGDLCWNAPLPCTPYYRPDLQLRRAGDLSSGFRLDDTIVYAATEEPSPPDVRVSGRLGLALPGPGWGAPDENGIRWCRSGARMVIRAEEAGVAWLQMSPRAIRLARQLVPRAELVVQGIVAEPAALSLAVGVPSGVRLHVHKGFNVVEFRLGPVPGEEAEAGDANASGCWFEGMSLESVDG